MVTSLFQHLQQHLNNNTHFYVEVNPDDQQHTVVSCATPTTLWSSLTTTIQRQQHMQHQQHVVEFIDHNPGSFTVQHTATQQRGCIWHNNCNTTVSTCNTKHNNVVDSQQQQQHNDSFQQRQQLRRPSQQPTRLWCHQSTCTSGGLETSSWLCHHNRVQLLVVGVIFHFTTRWRHRTWWTTVCTIGMCTQHQTQWQPPVLVSCDVEEDDDSEEQDDLDDMDVTTVTFSHWVHAQADVPVAHLSGTAGTTGVYVQHTTMDELHNPVQHSRDDNVCSQAHDTQRDGQHTTLCCTQFHNTFMFVSPHIHAMNTATLATHNTHNSETQWWFTLSRGVFQCGRATGALFLAVSSNTPTHVYNTWTTVTQHTLDDTTVCEVVHTWKATTSSSYCCTRTQHAHFNQLMPFHNLRTFSSRHDTTQHIPQW